MKCHIALVTRVKKDKNEYEEYFQLFSIKYTTEEMQEKADGILELNKVLGFWETKVQIFRGELIHSKETV